MTLDRRHFLFTAGASLAASRSRDRRLRRRRALCPRRRPVSATGPGARPVRRFPRLGTLRLFLHRLHPRPVRDAIDNLRRAMDENPFDVVEHGLFSRPTKCAGLPPSTSAVDPRISRSRDARPRVSRSSTPGCGSNRCRDPDDHPRSLLPSRSIRLAANRTGPPCGPWRSTTSPGGRARTKSSRASPPRCGRPPRGRLDVGPLVHGSEAAAAAIGSRRRGGQHVARSRDRVLLVVDGVHGFGVEDERSPGSAATSSRPDTQVDLRPRGTGLIWGREEAWAQMQPTVPAFEMGRTSPDGEKGPGADAGRWASPGGFHAYEHMWALPRLRVPPRAGRAPVAQRIHELNGRIKEGLAALRHVTVHTPRPRPLRGLVCFEVAGMTAETVVRRLHERVSLHPQARTRTTAAVGGKPSQYARRVDAAVRAVGALG